ncbi:expressed unknown protein [Ectocarpus siliculosus]|uniref:Uncharacterized protein n=1 Tax=Ectocarpus siliculosus TaxID=2880 RepID=D7FPM4_ECTSI|nr:expressed unknown protein [Ectocarpus siliculosus]|eukprot:CBJ30481.1 expressed unknown protein [Ectocarpus siliculosus]
MLRCRGQYLALRRLGEALGPTTRWDLKRRGVLLAAAGRRRTRSSGGAALSGGIPDGVPGSKVPAAYAATGAFAHADDNKAAGSASSELRAWQAAMIELAQRHSAKQAIGHDSKDPNKVSKHTAEHIPGGVWPKMANHFLAELIRACDGGARGAAAGVGPWASPGWDVARIQAATGSTSASAAAAAAALPRSSSMSAPSSISQARVSAAGAGAEFPLPDCRLDWRRALEVIKEAHLAGVEVRPDLMALVLSKVPVGNSRKISRLVSNKGSRAFGLQASTPDMLAVAAVAHWREGVVTGAARHLDEMFARIKKLNKEMVASPSSLVQEWLAADRQRIRDAAAAAAVETPPSHPPERQWPWRLVAVDIYGRANRWAAAAEAFDAFIGDMGFPSSRNGRRRRRRRRRRSVEGTAEMEEEGEEEEEEEVEEEEEEEAHVSARIAKPTRLPLPEEFGGGAGGGGGKKKAGEFSSPLPLQAWLSFHPSAIAHAITAYLKLGRVEEAAEVLSFLKASVRAGGATPAAGGLSPGYVGGSEEGGGYGGRAGSDPSLSGPPTVDPGWMEGTVRGFTRAGKWDMALEVLSTDIVAWFSAETGGDRRSGDGGGGARLVAASESLEAFLEAKLEAKKPASGQVAGSKACLELLKVAAGAQRGVSGDGGAAIATAAAAAATAAEEENDRPAASAVAVLAPGSRGREQGWQREETTPSATAATAAAPSPVARETHGSDRVPGKGCDTPEPGGGDARVGKAEGDGSGSSEPVVDRHRQDALVYTEAIRWLLPGGRLAPDRADGGTTPEAAGGDIPAHLLPAIELFSDGCRSMLRSGCRSASQEAVLQTMCKVWGGAGGTAVAAEDAGDATKERRRSASLALYEAGVESKALPADAHWASQSAGVLNLDCVDYQMHHGMPLAALNLVLSDMRRKYAYEETVERHVHPPQGDLVMITSVKGSWPALDNLKGILWLLGSCRFDGPLDGDLELLGQPGERRHPPTDNAATRERGDGNQGGRRRQLELLREAQESMRSPGRGLVVSLSRRTLQGWLLREGRAWSRANVGGGGGGGRLWKPSWVEDGIDVVPPVLPGLLTARDDGTDVVAGGVGSGEISGSAQVDAREGMRDSLYQGVA